MCIDIPPLRRFPKATIVSVEPSRGNYEMLRMNTKVFRNVLPVHSALWNRVTTLAMTNGAPKDLEWAFMVQEKKDVRAESFSCGGSCRMTPMVRNGRISLGVCKAKFSQIPELATTALRVFLC